ncbi:RNA-dependent RNA polymerase 1 [Caerostris extrusa]|uniref:RNA-dependent RNA polymerase n=1 Tax=Caerostris extrusa TaxID=172846 RepID=A0AAV4PX37_CAEEX|nr:RNA-dependent RNA polymerase 1 [Caerostris extrusa]
MLGVIDETYTLEYGQIFVQYSEELGNRESHTKILKGIVVVTKNPCMHPGDVRKLEAVDVPALHHIKDCIVFPAKGERPHPDEMAGSDLDGDEYVVIWYDPLIFPEQNYPPMSYPPNPEKTHQGPIQVSDMIDFLCEYIQNDNIGVMANAHLAWADIHQQGIFSKVCMNIAKKYPLVLDFAKSGHTCYLSSEEKPKVVRNLEACVSKVDVVNLEHEVDEHLIYEGWEDYAKSAEVHRLEYTKRVKNILKKYGLRSEAEVLTGYVGKMNEYTLNRYERDNALSIARTYIMDAIKRFRMEFNKAFDNERRANNVKSNFQEMKYRMASAWYAVTYRRKDAPLLSFPWILHDLLCEIREKNLKLKRLPCSIPESSFIDSSDGRLLQLRQQYLFCLDQNCYCVLVLLNSVQDWMTKSTLNLTMSAGDSFCLTCFDRIINEFLKTLVPQCCCFGKSCCCANTCSPTKLILEFLKFYATEISDNEEATLDDNPFEEGDPIRVSVTEDFEVLLTHHRAEVLSQLKKLSGVKDIFISAEADQRNNWYILVQSIGKGWQRWNLEELIMDKDIAKIIKSLLKSN